MKHKYISTLHTPLSYIAFRHKSHYLSNNEIKQIHKTLIEAAIRLELILDVQLRLYDGQIVSILCTEVGSPASLSDKMKALKLEMQYTFALSSFRGTLQFQVVTKDIVFKELVSAETEFDPSRCLMIGDGCRPEENDWQIMKAVSESGGQAIAVCESSREKWHADIQRESTIKWIGEFDTDTPDKFHANGTLFVLNSLHSHFPKTEFSTFILDIDQTITVTTAESKTVIPKELCDTLSRLINVENKSVLLITAGGPNRIIEILLPLYTELSLEHQSNLRLFCLNGALPVSIETYLDPSLNYLKEDRVALE